MDYNIVQKLKKSDEVATHGNIGTSFNAVVHPTMSTKPNLLTFIQIISQMCIDAHTLCFPIQNVHNQDYHSKTSTKSLVLTHLRSHLPLLGDSEILIARYFKVGGKSTQYPDPEQLQQPDIWPIYLKALPPP